MSNAGSDIEGIVVSDTGPIRYLAVLDKADVLPALYGTIHVPPAVAEELAAASAPPAARSVIAGRPPWLRVEGDVDKSAASVGRHRGETQAIALALRLSALLLCDDMGGRRAGRAAGLRVIGTLRILAEAAVADVLADSEFDRLLARLRDETNFRATPELYRLTAEQMRRDRLALDKLRRDAERGGA